MNKLVDIFRLLLAVLALSVSTARAQEVLWKKNFGGNGADRYTSVAAVSDGVVVVGYSSNGTFDTGDWAGVTGKGNDDAIIVKYDNDGNVVWYKNFGGSGEDRYNVVTAVSDGVVAVGRSSSTSFGNGDWAGVTGKGGVSDAIIVKYDNDGGVVWQKNFGGSDSDTYESVTTVPDGIVAIGYSSSGSFGNGDWVGVTGKYAGGDAIVVKYDNAGNVVWRKNFGGGDVGIFKSVTAVSDGVVVVGYSAPGSFGVGDWTGVTGKGDYDATIVKYDNDGEVVWKKNFGGSYWDYYYSVTTVSDGIVAAGYASIPLSLSGGGDGDWTGVNGKGSNDVITVKYDNDGNVVWKKNFGGPGTHQCYSVAALSDGVVIVGHCIAINGGNPFGNNDWVGATGNGGGEAIIVTYDNDGYVGWKKFFGGSGEDFYYSVTAVSDGIVAVGNSIIIKDGDWEGFPLAGNAAIIVKYYTPPPPSPSSVTATSVNFACPGGVTVTYDLVSDVPVDLTLYYSVDKCTWLEAIAVSGDLYEQTTGSGTIVWDNDSDNVVWGKFYFKVAIPASCDTGACVLINGVCWAKSNLDSGGVFCENQEEYGAYYQWGRKSDGHESSSSLTIAGPASVGDLDGDGQPAGSFFGKFITAGPVNYNWCALYDPFLWNSSSHTSPIKTVNDPCPCGWRVPTRTELQSLTDLDKVTRAWTIQNGIQGYLLTDDATSASLFLPVAGNRQYSGGAPIYDGTYGYYWSSTPDGAFAYYLRLNSGDISALNNSYRANGFSIRCVKE